MGRRRREGRSRLPNEQGARLGARSQDPEIRAGAEGRHLTEPLRHASWLDLESSIIPQPFKKEILPI